MVCRSTGHQFRLTLFAALVALGLALPAAAQNIVIGKVTDVKGQPVEGATVVIEQPSSGRKYESKTGKNGEYTQVGLIAGAYTVTVTKEGVGTSKGNVNVRGGRVPANFVLGMTAGEGLSKVFNEGVAASAAGNFDEAIAKFNEAIKTNPQCADCYYNIGVAQSGKKDYAGAEAAYKKAIEQNPNSADSYNGLAQALTAQKKSDEASAAAKKAAELMSSAPAGGGGNAEQMVNQGKIFINAGNMADAKTQFQKAVAADPNHADAHFYLGNAWVGEGNFGEAVKEFETYLKLAPSGPNAKQAQDAVTALKPLVK
jgi:cytochrome c-type biogenesis protein CcmH/NrfG